MTFRTVISRILNKARRNREQEERRWEELRMLVNETKMLTAKVLTQNQSRGRLTHIADAEFKVFSQFGEDGVIQYLVQHLQIAPATFIEFGVENYREANTRFLLVNNNWRGLVFDGSEAHIRSIKRDPIYWQRDLKAVSAFIDRDNIDSLIAENGMSGDLGILSIDIDGNDYWVWERITCVQPVVVIVEYNSLFGPYHKVSVPYDAIFQRTRTHFSNLYSGCSLAALCWLGENKGYSFVGSESAGNNAFFVRKDCLGDLRPLDATEGFVDSKFRESRGVDGQLTYLAGEERLKAIANEWVVDVITGENIRCGDLNRPDLTLPANASIDAPCTVSESNLKKLSLPIDSQ